MTKTTSVPTLLGTLVHVHVHLLILNFNVCQGLLPLKSDLPMGHDRVEFRIRKFPLPPPRKTDVREVGSFRLPRSISPIHYDLQIRPIIDSEEMYGEQYSAPGIVSIHVKCLSSTRSLTLHAKLLEIDFSGINMEHLNNTCKSDPVHVTGYNMDEEDDRNFLTIFFDRELTPNGEYKITIPFTALIAHPEARMSGIYRTTYKGSDGTRKTLVVTQFQKAYAREAFPCFDEPSYLFKATFSLKIGRRPHYTSFSNTEIIGEPEPIKDCPGWVWDTYSKTVKLPIYAIAFAVTSDYAAEASSLGIVGTPIKTWLPKAMLTKTNTNFTAQASAHILKYFEELFDFPYPNSKMDNFGAIMNLWGMEHLGLVTYRPFLLSWDGEENTQFEKWTTANLIAHEYAHMWFGNLVTCEWWDDFWLNEGFATYFQLIGAQQSGPDFRAKDRFVIDVSQWAKIFDEGPDSAPVHALDDPLGRVQFYPVRIEYDKAGALIRMMATFLTQDTFFAALKTYFKRHQFGNTVQDDLFQAMTDQARKDRTLTQFTVKQVMDTWTKLKGFPVIRVSRASNDTVYISQHRFVYHPSSHSIESSHWYVPIWYVTKSSPNFHPNQTTPQFWMDKHTIISYFNVGSTDEWIIVNPEARGYYRVFYDDHLTTLIISQLEEDHTQFHFATRAQLIDDYFRSAQARYISIRYALDMTWYLPHEDDLIVWTTALNNLKALYTRLIDTSIANHFRKYLLRLVIPPLKRLGLKELDTDTPSDIMLRGQLLDWACALEHELCIEHAQKMFGKWMENPENRNPIPTEYQPQLYCAEVAANSTNQKVVTFLLKHYRQANSSRQKNLVIKALACAKTEDYLKGLLAKVTVVNDPDIDVPKHGRLLLESLVSSTQIARNMTWKHLKKKYNTITEIHGAWTVPKIVSTLAPYASSRGLSKLNIDITSFISNYTQNGNGGMEAGIEIERSLQKDAHKIVENSYWMEYYFEDVKRWLMSHVKI